MFKNYFRTAFRSLMKNKATSLINILGLSIGISAALIIFLIIRYEYSFDKWEPDRENIYRIYTQWGPEGNNDGISTLAPKEIAAKVTGMDVVAHFYTNIMSDATIDVKRFNKTTRLSLPDDKGICFADDQYFKIFPGKWLAGSAKPLGQLNNTVLSESYAKYFFPNVPLRDIVGKQLVFDDSITTTVAGVVADLKETTDYGNKIFVSLKSLTETSLLNSFVGTPGWDNVNANSQCFIHLHAGTEASQVNRQLRRLYASHIKKGKASDPDIYARLQPLRDVHLNTQLNGDGAKKSLRNIALLAAVLIFLASINFINLTTAQSSLRAKEIGVRKTFGSNKRQIILQFLSETFLLISFSTLLALVLYPVLFHLFKSFVPDGMPIDTISQPLTAIYLIVLMIVLTITSGIYPAFIMSGYRPIEALKGKVNTTGKPEKIWLRQSLIVFQFIVAQVFLIVVFVVGKQIRFLLSKDMGFKKDAIVSFYTPWSPNTSRQVNVLYNELKTISGIQHVSVSSGTPAQNGFNTTSLTYSDKGTNKTYNNVHVRNIDGSYVQLFGLKLLAGNNIRVDTSARIPEVLINETLMKQIGFRSPEDAIGTYLRGGSADSSIVVGVVKDFSTMSLMNAIQPTVLFANDFGYASTISFSLRSNNPEDWNKTIKEVEKSFGRIYVSKTFSYQFFDKTIESLYRKQIQLATLLKWATGLSIFISCMGLIGLVMFLANQRTKEIGIRKVLGASVPQILRLLSGNLIGLVLLASVISFPIAWYYSHGWLADFAYKTALNWWIFPVCALGMLLISLLILWSWSLRAAKANPANVLRTE